MAAEILGRTEDLLWDLSDRLEPEDGMLWIQDVGGKPSPSPSSASKTTRDHQRPNRSRNLTSSLAALLCGLPHYAYEAFELRVGES